MRSEIYIPKGGDGANVFANRGGGVSICQSPSCGEEICIALTVDEASEVADALREITQFIKNEEVQ